VRARDSRFAGECKTIVHAVGVALKLSDEPDRAVNVGGRFSFRKIACSKRMDLALVTM